MVPTIEVLVLASVSIHLLFFAAAALGSVDDPSCEMPYSDSDRATITGSTTETE